MEPSKDSIARFPTMHTVGDGCWEWTGTKDKDGYGRFRIGSRQYARAHRLAWLIANGDPGGKFVCHRCDNPSCVRLDHLFLGSALDNNRDKMAKGRMNPARGERSGTAKLTEQDVQAIRELYRLGNVRQKDLAERFNVSQSAVHLILKATNWATGSAPVVGMRHAPKLALRALSDESKAALVAEYVTGGITQSALARKYGVSQQYVSTAVRAT